MKRPTAVAALRNSTANTGESTGESEVPRFSEPTSLPPNEESVENERMANASKADVQNPDCFRIRLALCHFVRPGFRVIHCDSQKTLTITISSLTELHRVETQA